MKINSRSIKRFVKYSGVGFSTFLLDLCILYLLVEVFNLNYLVSTSIAFFMAVSVNYAVSRKVVFVETKRSFLIGYLNFISIAVAGIGLTLTGMYIFVSIFGLNYLIARCMVSGAVGINNYIFNLIFNFKIAKIDR